MNLFDDTKTMTRRTDPATSREAATLMHTTGTTQAHAQIVLEQIRKGPGRTAGELANSCPFDSVEVTRRVGALRDAGLIESRDARVCHSKGTRMATHWPVKGGSK